MLAAVAGRCRQKRGSGAHLLCCRPAYALRPSGPGMTEDSGYDSDLDQVIGSQVPTESFGQAVQADQAGTPGHYQYGQLWPGGLPRRLPT